MISRNRTQSWLAKAKIDNFIWRTQDFVTDQGLECSQVSGRNWNRVPKVNRTLFLVSPCFSILFSEDLLSMLLRPCGQKYHHDTPPGSDYISRDGLKFLHQFQMLRRENSISQLEPGINCRSIPCLVFWTSNTSVRLVQWLLHLHHCFLHILLFWLTLNQPFSPLNRLLIFSTFLLCSKQFSFKFLL